MSDVEPQSPPRYPSWLTDSLDYVSRLKSLGQSGAKEATGDVLEEIQDYTSGSRNVANLRSFEADAGMFIRVASDLENAVATFAAGVTVPEDPMQFIPAMLGMTASQRSLIVRKLAGSERHWKAFVDEVEAVAVLRNHLAHGNWTTFKISSDGQSVLYGRFIQSFRKTRRGWTEREIDVSGDSLIVACRKATVLSLVAQNALLASVMHRHLEGSVGVPTNLRETCEGPGVPIPDECKDTADGLFGLLPTPWPPMDRSHTILAP